MKKPMIGVLPLYDTDKKSYWMLPNYMNAIEEAGGIPIMLPLTTDIEIIATLADEFDGFLFTGDMISILSYIMSMQRLPVGSCVLNAILWSRTCYKK